LGRGSRARIARVTEELTAFIGDPTKGSFEALALRAFAERCGGSSELGTWWRSRVSPAAVNSWRDVPAVPADLAPKLIAELVPPGATWPLLSETLDAAFPRSRLPVLAGGAQPAFLLLVPPTPESGLARATAEQLGARFGGERGLAGWGARGLDVPATRSWAGARQREQRPVVIVATEAALARWLAALVRLDLRFRLAAGSLLVLLEGGTAAAAEHAPALAERLALSPAATLHAYRPPGIVSLCYGSGENGAPYLGTPPWMRARVLDPAGRIEVEAGTPGVLALFDLASPLLHVLTGDRAVADRDGFRLL
jgi:hypothetical protein